MYQEDPRNLFAKLAAFDRIALLMTQGAAWRENANRATARPYKARFLAEAERAENIARKLALRYARRHEPIGSGPLAV